MWSSSSSFYTADVRGVMFCSFCEKTNGVTKAVPEPGFSFARLFPLVPLFENTLEKGESFAPSLLGKCGWVFIRCSSVPILLLPYSYDGIGGGGEGVLTKSSHGAEGDCAARINADHFWGKLLNGLYCINGSKVDRETKTVLPPEG